MRAVASDRSRSASSDGSAIAGQAAQVRPGRLVAEDDRVGLAAVHQRQRHARVGRVEQAALALDQVPVVGVVVRGQPLDRAGHEVGDHRVERHAAAGDQDAGLAGGAEGRGHAARPHLALHGERGVHLADRAVGAHGEQPPAACAAGRRRSGSAASGTRTSCSRRPCAIAVATSSARRAAGCAGPRRGRARPPAPPRARSSQAGEITPPRLATPTTSVRAPAAAASAMPMSGRPMSARQPCIRYWPIAASGRQSRMPCATFAASASGASPRNRR